MPVTSFDRKQLILPAIIFLLALLIRLPGLTWGLKDSQHNQSLHPDEDLNFRITQAINPAHLDFAPGWYHYGTLYFTTFRIASDVVYGYSGSSDHPDTDWDYIRKGELAGRTVSLLAGALLCVVTFFAARRITTELGAAAAGIAMAVAPALVVHSRFATVDMLAALFAALSMLYALRIVADSDPPWMRTAILAGVCAGLSAGTKYTGGLAILMPLVALLVRRPTKTVLLALASVGASALAFVLSTPGVLVDTKRFLEDFNYERVHTAAGHDMVFTGTAPGYIFHIQNLFLGFGALMTVMGAAALVWAAFRKQQWAWVVLAFAVPYYLLIGGAQVKFIRYVFPLTFALAAGFGYAVGEGNRNGRAGHALVGLGIIGVGGFGGPTAGGLRGTWLFTAAMLGQDNRELVKPYVLAATPDGRDVTVGLISDPWFWSPTLYPDTTMARFFSPALRRSLLLASSHPHAEMYLPPDGSEPLPYDAGIVAMKPDYIAYSDFEVMYVDRVANLPQTPSGFIANVDRYKEFKKALEAAYTPAIQFGDAGDMVEDMRYVMPTVFVWKRKP